MRSVGAGMHIEVYAAESLRMLVRLLELCKQAIKRQIEKENIPYEESNHFEEMIENAEVIFDSDNYMEKFEQNLVEAEKSIVISSPNIR